MKPNTEAPKFKTALKTQNLKLGEVLNFALPDITDADGDLFTVSVKMDPIAASTFIKYSNGIFIVKPTENKT